MGIVTEDLGIAVKPRPKTLKVVELSFVDMVERDQEMAFFKASLFGTFRRLARERYESASRP